MKKLNVGIIGATGMVGQRFITLSRNHPYYDIVLVAASSSSAGKTYAEAVKGRWKMKEKIPANITGMKIYDASDIGEIGKHVDFVFCAINMEKEALKALEFGYAEAGIPVISNNSAHRWTPEVPMIIPEVNPYHLKLIEHQKNIHNWEKGFVVTKPNCSIQSYVPVLAALQEFGIKSVFVATYQAISGSGLLLTDEQAAYIQNNVVPLPGEEEKSESEPLKIFGELRDGRIINAQINISAHCQRVAAEDGHKAVFSVAFEEKPTKEQVIEAIQNWNPFPQKLKLPSAPTPCLVYLPENDRPQTKLDRSAGNGMAISVGRIRECPILDWKFDAFSHNTIRGAAGGAILTAELLIRQGYILRRI